PGALPAWGPWPEPRQAAAEEGEAASSAVGVVAARAPAWRDRAAVAVAAAAALPRHLQAEPSRLTPPAYRRSSSATRFPLRSLLRLSPDRRLLGGSEPHPSRCGCSACCCCRAPP